MPPPPPTTILVVDDETDMRLLIRAVVHLANHGLTIVGEAADGVEALEAWRALDAPVPDVIVLDNRMPRRSGIEAAAQILRERLDQLIVLYSAFLDDRVRAQAADVRISSCLSKEDLAGLPELIWSLRAA